MYHLLAFMKTGYVFDINVCNQSNIIDTTTIQNSFLVQNILKIII